MSNLQVITVNETLVVDSRLVAEELGIQHKNVRQTIEKYLTELQGFGVVTFETSKPSEYSQGGRPERYCYLNEDQATFLMTLSRNTPQVVACKQRLVQAFSQAKHLNTEIVPQTPQTYLEALKALVKAEEERQLLELQKELLESENEALSEAVDELFDYSSIIRVAKYNNVSETDFNWRMLKAASRKLGVEIKKVPCPRFEYKNLYSHDAWRLAYPQYRLPETTTLKLITGI